MVEYNGLTEEEREFMAQVYLAVQEYEEVMKVRPSKLAKDIELYIAKRRNAQ